MYKTTNSAVAGGSQQSANNNISRASYSPEIELPLKALTTGNTTRQQPRCSPRAVPALPPSVPNEIVRERIMDEPSHSRNGINMQSFKELDEHPPEYGQATGVQNVQQFQEVNIDQAIAGGSMDGHTPPVVLLRNGGVMAPNGRMLSDLNPSVYPTHSQTDDGEETDDEIVQTFSRAVKSVHVVIPSKSQVLLYFANATTFRLSRIGTDLQVTDSSDNPLFDVWVEMDCCRCTWVIEAYGKVVMMMHEKPSNMCCGPRRPPITISDWNGDLFGYLVPGDPFLLQNPDRQTIAKLVPHQMPYDMSQPYINTATVTSGSQSSLAGSSTLREQETTLANGTTTPDQRMCWLCVMEGTGRHIVRLEGFDTIQYNKDVSFQLKLLALAGVIRLSAPWNMPRRGDGAPGGGIWSIVSTILNFCAYCLY